MIRRLLMGCGFLLCVIGLFGLLTAIDTEPETLTPERADSTTRKVKVWLAARHFRRGDKVTEADLKVAMVSGTSASKNGGVSSTEPWILAAGTLAGRDIVEGDRVSADSVLAPGQPGYIELLIDQGMVPYPLAIEGVSGYQAVLTPGDLVDVVMIASLEQNLANKATLDSYRGLTVGPLLQRRRVLAVDDGLVAEATERQLTKTTVILELSREDISRLMIARRLALLDVHKSSPLPLPEVKAGDVLPDFYSVTELRGGDRVVN